MLVVWSLLLHIYVTISALAFFRKSHKEILFAVHGRSMYQGESQCIAWKKACIKKISEQCMGEKSMYKEESQCNAWKKSMYQGESQCSVWKKACIKRILVHCMEKKACIKRMSVQCMGGKKHV